MDTPQRDTIEAFYAELHSLRGMQQVDGESGGWGSFLRPDENAVLKAVVSTVDEETLRRITAKLRHDAEAMVDVTGHG